MNYQNELNDLLVKTVDFNDIKDFALKLKDEGLDKEACYAIFAGCMKEYEAKDGPEYNVILDVMDLISGYCRPSESIY